MKNLIYFLVSLFVAIALVWFLHDWFVGQDDPGYVLIGFEHSSVEMTLVVFSAILVLGFFLAYYLFRWLGMLIRLPAQIKKNRLNIKFNRSQEALIAGLFDTADGNWERAENILIKHAANSGAPLLHYLTAARAAQSRGALDKRDEYLKKATAQTSETNITVGLTQAELHLSEQQFEQALETLAKLHSVDPGHARVLKMMHQAYQHLDDWEGLSKLLPSLQQNKILLEGEVKLLETQTYSRLLKKAAAANDEKTIQACWDDVPEHIKTLPGVANIYFAAMIAAGAGLQVEAAIIAQLTKHWDDTLLVLYADIAFPEPEIQLHQSEKWLAVYANDPVLQRMLGKLALKAQQLEKAEQYLLKSIHLDPSVDAFQLLGDLLIVKGDKDKACDYFKQALNLACSEVINRAESISA